METLLILLSITITAGLAFIIWKLLNMQTPEKDNEREKLQVEKDRLLEESIRLKSEVEKKAEESGKITAELKAIESERDELSGKNKQMFVQSRDLQNDVKNLQTENSELKKKIAKYEEETTRREKEFHEKVEKLENSRHRLEKEQERVIREDEEKQKKLMEQRDRMWNNHENEVIAILREVCQKPEIGFQCFDNTTLPEKFDGSFKPDFIISFLGQYLYLDAKVSRSDNLQTYLQTQFKSTVTKLKKNPQIYKSVFFIVPSEAISSLKKRTESIEGYTFFVIAPESIEPILSAYKRISEYQNLEEFDPEEREKIVDVLSKFEHFIRNQNTANILFVQKAFETLSERGQLSDTLQKELELSLKNLKHLKFKDSEMKKLSENIQQQQKVVQQLTTPQIKIPEQEITKAQKQLFEEESPPDKGDLGGL